MAIKEIITYPHPVLREKAKKITTFDDELKKLASDMGETMYNAPGVGLAANQIGLPVRIVVVDVSKEKDEKKFIPLVNPVLSEGEGSEIDEEGCLSVIEYQAKVKRFRKIKVTAQDLDGKEMEFIAEDRFARIIQHEVDHLNGTLFIDRISRLKLSLYKKKLKKILRQKK
ncbi:MAG TPA: peptide deformylase [Desulfobulbus sp.]|nr:peptide deformylase [Desulfobulbus sp.]